uniref:Tubulin-specific chaperone B (inferred by orthology to a C. elegans protein) n=1 Tax=Strongyloides venezuelensis TaxID=75913 RepID=A0A0K0EV11_STRVS
MLDLTIFTNVSDFPYKKKFDENISLKDFKQKMIMIAGIEQLENMQVELIDEQKKPIMILEDDSKTLTEYNLSDDSFVLVKDISGSNTEFLNNDIEERYIMSNEKYASRENSVRNFKKQIIENTKETTYLKVGDRVVVTAKDEEKTGTVAYVGEVEFADGLWIGVNLDLPKGKNDGSVNGKRYFECSHNHGSFVKPRSCELLDTESTANAPEEL